MPDLTNIYKIHKKITKDKLRRHGFRVSDDKAYYDKWVYKDIIRMSIVIDLTKNEWSHDVINTDWNTIYGPYYFWDGGTNLMLDEVNANVANEFELLRGEKIFWRVKEKKHV